MGRCCGPNDLENMHPAQQSSAASMRAVTAAVLADAASVLADAASALADTASALAFAHKIWLRFKSRLGCFLNSLIWVPPSPTRANK